MYSELKTVQEAEKSRKKVEEPEKETEEPVEEEEEDEEATKCKGKKEANKSKQLESEDGFGYEESTPLSDTQIVYEAMGRSVTGTKIYE